ncbi:MAG TPA: proprotein convertase P-domain-containing protein [Sedimentisphaerales bacterium]|nr:proprotein convertase P-domain-containing protein [Sedimentisphaerales bacterium]
MWRKWVLLISFVVALGSTSQAALYLWNGGAGDGLWETPANWTVTDSLWTWPNEETGGEFINIDALMIDILDGGAVTRGDTLRIKGADELTPAVLTVDNASSLSVNGRLSIGADPNAAPRMGELNVLNGSTLTILDGPNGNDLYVADDANSVGTVNIVDSILNIFDDINLDEGEGYVNISGSSTVNADDIIAGNSVGGVGYVDIGGTATVNVDDLKTDDGEGHITIGGDATLNLDDLIIDNPDGVLGTVDIGGAATVTVADDIMIDEATGTINIGGTATVSNGDDFMVGDDPPGVGYVNIGDDATVTVGDLLYVAHNEGAEGHLTISGNATVNILDDLIVANAGGVTATLHISGNPTINITSEFYMNDDDGAPANSQTIMDGGTVIIGSYCTFNDDNPGTAEFIMNGGSWYCADYLNLSDNLDGTAHLTMNGGEMITGNRLRLGKDGGEDTGQVRIFMNGGLLQAEDLDIKITDTQIVHTGGDLRINSANVSEDDIRQMIADGTIVVTGEESVDYFIISAGGYTALTGPPVKAWTPEPADGATGVSYAPPIATYVSSDVPKPVPDRNFIPPGTTVLGEAVSILNVPDSFKVKDLNIEFDIKMPNNADLNVYLKDPGGKQITLFEDIGAGSNFKNTILDDEASTKIGGPRDPFTGRFKPASSLSGFDGRNARGNWQLKIIDDWYGGAATLNSWQLVIEQPLLLGWKPAISAVSQKVYFSDNFDKVSSNAASALAGNLGGSASSVDVGALALGQTYYWRVNAVDPNGNPMPDGDIWSFTTAIGNVVVDQRITDGADDVEERPNDAGNIDVTSSDLEFPYEEPDLAQPQIVAMRFVNVEIPAGADILQSSLEFEVDETKGGTDPVNVLVNAQLTPDAEPFMEEAYNVSTRPSWTTAVVPWSVPEWTAENVKFQTPDISAIIEELVNQDGWGSGKAMVFAIADDPCNPSTGVRCAEAYEGEASAAPRLRIDATTEAASAPNPASGAVRVPLETVLSWKPGFSTVARNVYFGTTSSPKLVGMTTGITLAPKLAPSTTYYWKVDELEANGTKHAGTMWSFTTVPAEATEPDPADGATDVASDAILSWTAGVKAGSHDVYFGTSSPPPFIGNQAETSYDPGILRLTSTFYWRIDEIDTDGTKHIGDVWSFSTLSGQASQPDPADGALIEQTYALLGWTAGLTAASHNVYISDNLDYVTSGAEAAFAGNQTETTLSVGIPGVPVPDGLVPGSTYYWRVDAVEADPNVVHEGAVWSFSVLSDKANNPDPADGAIDVATSVQLSWSPGLAAKLHSVYFGDDPDVVANAVEAPPLPLTTYDPGALEPGKTYYWRVDEFNPPALVKGDVWSFTTAP